MFFFQKKTCFFKKKQNTFFFKKTLIAAHFWRVGHNTDGKESPELQSLFPHCHCLGNSIIALYQLCASLNQPFALTEITILCYCVLLSGLGSQSRLFFVKAGVGVVALKILGVLSRKEIFQTHKKSLI